MKLDYDILAYEFELRVFR